MIDTDIPIIRVYLDEINAEIVTVGGLSSKKLKDRYDIAFIPISNDKCIQTSDKCIQTSDIIKPFFENTCNILENTYTIIDKINRRIDNIEQI